MDEQQTFTLSEAAEATGLTVDALRQRIKRGKLRSFRGNDGRVMLRLDRAELDALKPLPSDQDATSRLHSQPASRLDSESSTIRALEGEAATLREALDRERVRVDRAEAALDQQRAELASRQARLDGLEAELTATRARADAELAQRLEASTALGEALDRAREAVEAATAARRELDSLKAGSRLTRALRAIRGRDKS